MENLIRTSDEIRCSIEADTPGRLILLFVCREYVLSTWISTPTNNFAPRSLSRFALAPSKTNEISQLVLYLNGWLHRKSVSREYLTDKKFRKSGDHSPRSMSLIPLLHRMFPLLQRIADCLPLSLLLPAMSCRRTSLSIAKQMERIDLASGDAYVSRRVSPAVFV